MAHLITGNKFDPNKDIPDLDGKVYSYLLKHLDQTDIREPRFSSLQAVQLA